VLIFIRMDNGCCNTMPVLIQETFDSGIYLLLFRKRYDSRRIIRNCIKIAHLQLPNLANHLPVFLLHFQTPVCTYSFPISINPENTNIDPVPALQQFRQNLPEIDPPRESGTWIKIPVTFGPGKLKKQSDQPCNF